MVKQCIMGKKQVNKKKQEKSMKVFLVMIQMEKWN